MLLLEIWFRKTNKIQLEQEVGLDNNNMILKI